MKLLKDHNEMLRLEIDVIDNESRVEFCWARYPGKITDMQIWKGVR